MEPEALYSQAMADIDAGRHEEAQRLLAQVLVINPQHEQAWLALGLIVPEMDRAIECLHRVLKINPQNTEAQKYLQLAQDMKRRDESPTQPVDVQEYGLEGASEPDDADEDGTGNSPADRLPSLGRLLLETGALTPPQLDAALKLQRKLNEKGHPQRLGELLVERGVITPEQLSDAVRDQRTRFNNLFWD